MLYFGLALRFGRITLSLHHRLDSFWDSVFSVDIGEMLRVAKIVLLRFMSSVRQKRVKWDWGLQMVDSRLNKSLNNVSERCHSVSFVCTLLVILVHTTRIPQGWMSATDLCGLNWAAVLLNFGICSNLGRLAVPMFFAISGYWLVKSYKPTMEWWRQAVGKRIKTIVLPMVIWAVIALLYEFLMGGAKMPSYHNGFLPSEARQFWYYRTLFIFVVVSPVVIWILRRRVMGIGLVALIWLFAFVGMPGQHQYAMWIDQAAFMLGIYLGFHQVNLKLRSSWIILLCVIFMLTATVLGCLHMRILYNRAMYLVITFGCVSLWLLSPMIVRVMRPFPQLYSLNVFIFAIHFIVLGSIRNLLDFLGMKFCSASYMCVQYFLTVGICITLGLLLKAAAPRALRTLSGGRT